MGIHFFNGGFIRTVNIIPDNQIKDTIYFGWSTSPFGRCLILYQSNTIIGMAFKNDQYENQIEEKMKAPWYRENKKFEPANTDELAKNIFYTKIPMNISFIGSQFQRQVWKNLMTIPSGKTVTYADIAQASDYPKAVRPVATAVGKNPIAWLIPCHRIIRKSGDLGGYRWGVKIKKMILVSESAK